MTSLPDPEFCHLTSRGRLTGRPHTVELWFASAGSTVYFLSDGGGADWVRNLRRDPEAFVEIGGTAYSGTGRLVFTPEEEARARRELPAKYQAGYGGDLSEWGRTATLVAVDLRV